MSGDPEQEYFSDGITEDVITELSRFKNLFVIARNSSFTFKGQTVDVREVGQKLGVAYVVEGSVRRSSERVRITAQLIEASTGNHLWAERYDRAIEDIFEVQDDVVRAIATAIPGQIDTVTLLRAQRYPSANLSAYDCLLRGEWLRYQDWGSKEALALFEKAAELDPGCARAYAHLANWHAYSVWLLGRRHEDAQRDTAFYGELAARCGPNDPQVHANLAEAYSLAGSSHQARHHIEKAIKLNPNDYVVMMYAGFVLAFLGDYGSASEWHDKMIRADPLGIEAWRESLMESYCLMGRYEEAIEEAIECTKGWRDIPFHCLVSLASCHAQLGRREQAFALMNKHYRERPEGYDTGYVIRMAAEKIPIQLDRDRWLEGVRKAGFDI
jgi:TolB-like protein